MHPMWSAICFERSRSQRKRSTSSESIYSTHGWNEQCQRPRLTGRLGKRASLECACFCHWSGSLCRPKPDQQHRLPDYRSYNFFPRCSQLLFLKPNSFQSCDLHLCQYSRNSMWNRLPRFLLLCWYLRLSLLLQ
jgi:hypothetical protein